MVEKVRNSTTEAAEQAVAATAAAGAAAQAQQSSGTATRHFVQSGRSQTGLPATGRSGATRPSAHPSVLGSVAASKRPARSETVGTLSTAAGSASSEMASASSSSSFAATAQQVREDFARRRRRMITYGEEITYGE